MSYETINVSENIKLEQLKLTEAEVFFGLIDKDREYLARFLPWPNETKSIDDSIDFIKRMIKMRDSGEEYGYAIKYDDEIIGHISLMEIKSGCPKIGYWIASNYSGRGIMTEAARLFTDFALNIIGLMEVIILANPGNIGSNRVAEKVGYKFNGVMISESGETLNKWIISNG